MRALGQLWAGFLLTMLFSLTAQAVELHEGITYRQGLKLDIHAPDRPGRTAQAGGTAPAEIHGNKGKLAGRCSPGGLLR